MAVPYTFGTATAAIPLSQLDSNFATAITLGNTAVYLGNTTTSIGNLTLTNVTISSGSVTITDTTVSGNVTLSGGTANGVAYLNGSKVLTTGSALTFDGTNLGVKGGSFVSTTSADANYKSVLTTVYSDSATTQLYNKNILVLSSGTADGTIFYNQSGVEAMRLTSTGLGIGTSSPAYKLDVRGAGLVGNFVGSTYGQIQVQATGTNQNVYLTGNPNGTGKVILQYGGTDVMQYDSAGNLGLGVTPSAWSSSYSKAIQISTQGAYIAGNTTGYSGGTYAWFGNNGYLDSAAVFRYTTSTSACQYQQVANSHQWLNAPSGTAGNAITFTQAMTLDASGNLLVGTTTSGGAGGMSVLPLGGGAGTSAIQIFNKTNTASDSAILFRVSGTTVSGISYTSTVVTYGTVSDYRLKTVIGAVTDSGQRIDSLEPIEYTWNSNGSRTRGFLAHKFQEVYADSVTGTKDALDADGNPVYQGMQAGSTEVIADLVAEIQSLRKRLTALEGKA